MFFGLTIFVFVFKKSIFKPINTDVTQSKPINKNKKLHRIRDQRHVVRIIFDESKPSSSEFSWVDCCFRCDHSYKWYNLYAKVRTGYIYPGLIKVVRSICVLKICKYTTIYVFN